MTIAAVPLEQPRSLPSSQDILNYLRVRLTHKISRNDLIKAFDILPEDVPEFRHLLKSMRKQELIIKTAGNFYRIATDRDNIETEAIISEYLDERKYYGIIFPDKQEISPLKLVLYASKQTKPFKVGDKVVIKIKESSKKGRYGKIIKSDKKTDIPLKGMAIKTNHGFDIVPISKKHKWTYPVLPDTQFDLTTGDFVQFKVHKKHDKHGKKTYFADIIKIIGQEIHKLESISMIAIQDGHIPHQFSDLVLQEIEKIKPITLDNNAAKRQDLTHLPFITIDPHDAKDHDDAIYVELDNQTKGATLYVAIADVSSYVPSGSMIDQEAQNRGNSVYLPDQVVPMLPEHLSNNLCSLKENTIRPVLIAKIKINGYGKKTSHEFIRAFIHCQANLTYQDVYEASQEETLDSHIQAIIYAYDLLKVSRDKRAPLNLDLPEYQIILDKNNQPLEVVKKERLFTHRLIEEFMVLANVCAAETLDKCDFPVIYRSHDEPPADKVSALKDSLKTLGVRLKSRGSKLSTKAFNDLLQDAKGTATQETVSKMVLRSQCQAVYNTDNQGHFGLNLTHYTHFTSPIRRYADLMVHRYLIRAIKLGQDGITDSEIEQVKETCTHISMTERRAITAEIETKDRFLAELLKSRTSDQFKARISGVTNAGLFVRLPDYGAEGFIPIHYISGQSRKRRYFMANEARNILTDRYSGQYYIIGQDIHVTLLEANPLTGGMIFTIIDDKDLKNGSNVSSRKKKPLKKRKIRRPKKNSK